YLYPFEIPSSKDVGLVKYFSLSVLIIPNFPIGKTYFFFFFFFFFFFLVLLIYNHSLEFSTVIKQFKNFLTYIKKN
ncbi:hypothetical protein H8356DRAFT_938686, partial [Neocallimastix lanati (nom. inval.)]